VPVDLSIGRHACAASLARASDRIQRWHAASFVQYGTLDSGCARCHHVCAAGSLFIRRHYARQIITGSNGRGMGYVSE